MANAGFKTMYGTRGEREHSMRFGRNATPKAAKETRKPLLVMLSSDVHAALMRESKQQQISIAELARRILETRQVVEAE